MSVPAAPRGNSHSANIPSVPPLSNKPATPEKTEPNGREASPSFWTTHLSTKGQVVIPEQIRKDFGFQPGDQFVVVALNDLVFLKRV
jgi:AbrB family looped-hinge helix DNA binding protein